ncbi:MAG: histidinol-phosphate transaminase [Planctomycetota bacterium]|nr:histidinol-phosphate transaminase [Planctomycetota bacterium]
MNDQERSRLNFFRDNILQMSGYQSGEQPQGNKAIKLNTNENPYPCSPSVLQAIRSVDPESLRKYPDASAAAFRAVAAKQLGVEPEWILCGNGSDEILSMVTRAFVAPGQKVRWPFPSYVLYSVLVDIQDGSSQLVDFAPDWTLADEFSRDTGPLGLIFLANPNSPSGTLLSPAEILELVEKVPCPVLVDEAYADFSGTSCVDLVARNERLLVSRTLSKSHSLAGMRFGYLVAQPPVIEQLAKIKDSYNCDALSIAGATAAMNDQPWLEQNLEKVRSTRKKMVEQLELLGFEVTPSAANFVWCKHCDRSSREIYEYLKSRQLLVRYMHFDHWGDGLRITVGTDDQLDALVTLLESMLKNS